MKRAYSIAAVALALSLLVGYVVYSHRRPDKPAVAASTKSSIANLRHVDQAKATWSLEQKSVATETNSPPSSTPAP